MKTINTDIAQKIDIEARAHNSMTIKLNISNEGGSSFDLTGYSIFFDVENGNDNLLLLSNSVSTGYTDDAITTESGSTTLDGSGVVVVFATSTQMAINPGSYKYRMTLVKGESVKTWMYGKFKINKD